MAVGVIFPWDGAFTGAGAGALVSLWEVVGAGGGGEALGSVGGGPAKKGDGASGDSGEAETGATGSLLLAGSTAVAAVDAGGIATSASPVRRLLGE